MTEGRDHWWHELATDESDCPPEPMDAEDLLYLLYTSRHDREAEGDRAHDRRLPRRRRDDAPLRLRPQARLDVYWCAADVGWVTGHSYIVYGPLCNGTTSVSCTRARPTSPTRTAGGRSSSATASTILYTAPTAIRTHMKWGPEHARAARPLVAAAARLGRRADQPGGVGLVPRAHRRRPLPDRRHLVADRDRDDHDHAAPGRDDDEAGLGDAAVPGRRRRDLQRGRRGGRAGRRRLPRAEAAVAGDAARHLRRRRALPRDVLVEVRRRLLRRRRRADRRGRRLLAARPRRRRDERLGPPHLDDRGRVGARRPPGGRRGGRRGAQRRDDRARRSSRS